MPLLLKAKILRRLVVTAVLTLAILPAGAQAFQKAIWGPVIYNGVNQFPLYHRLGVRIYEASLDWATIAPRRPRNGKNPRDPAYSWPASVKQAVALARRYHMQIMLEIIFTPSWANHGGAPNVPPTTAALYGNFAQAAAREFPGVHLWMVWGEPDRSPNFSLTRKVPFGQRPSAVDLEAPHRYAELLDSAYGELKSVSRRNLVIGGSTYTTGDMDTQEWIENLRLPNGHRPRMDMYAHNPFSIKEPNFSDPLSPQGEVQFSDLHELARWVDRYLRKGMPLFLAEFTIPTAPDEEFTYYVDPPVAASWLSAALRLARHWKRIYALGWIHVYDDPPVSYGGLLTTQGKPKPDFYAFQHG